MNHAFYIIYLPNITNNEKQYIIQIVKHFSQYKKDTEIHNFVDSYNYNDTKGFYINNQPVSPLQAIVKMEIDLKSIVLYLY